LVLIALYLGSQVVPPRIVVTGPNPFRAREASRPLVIAHGGGQALFPANTLEAFAGSAAWGCDALEMDLRLTRDQVLVTHHDASVERLSDGQGLVRDKTLAELKALNFGYHFRDDGGAYPYRERPARLATLEELLQRHPAFLLVLELKDQAETGRAAARALAELLLRYHRETNAIVASFDDETLDAFRNASGRRVLTSAPRSRTRAIVLTTLVGLGWFAPTPDAALQIPPASGGYALDRPRLIRFAHRRNMAVHYWTINDREEMRRLIHLGADGLITDRPDRLLQLLADLGAPGHSGHNEAPAL
jgi:glycerophosphoryl diester phosphodiesterase